MPAGVMRKKYILKRLFNNPLYISRRGNGPRKKKKETKRTNLPLKYDRIWANEYSWAKKEKHAFAKNFFSK